jgi:hypothetical protein
MHNSDINLNMHFYLYTYFNILVNLILINFKTQRKPYGMECQMSYYYYIVIFEFM